MSEGNKCYSNYVSQTGGEHLFHCCCYSGWNNTPLPNAARETSSLYYLLFICTVCSGIKSTISLCKKLFNIADHCKGTQQQSRCQSDQYILANARWTQTNSLKVIQTNGRGGGTFVMRLWEIREKSTLEKQGLHRILRKYDLLLGGALYV